MALWNGKQIWKSMSREERTAAADAFWSSDQATHLDRAAALGPWLAARGLRMTYLQQLPRTRRSALMAQGAVPEETAIQLLLAFHLQSRRPILAAFLGELGIPHDDGLIKERTEVEPPSAEAAGKAVEALRAKFPAAEVDLYLRTLTASDPVTWEAVGAFAGDPA